MKKGDCPVKNRTEIVHALIYPKQNLSQTETVWVLVSELHWTSVYY